MSIYHEAPTDESIPDPDIVAAFYDGAAEALDFAWSAIHVMRFAADESNFMGLDDFYHGVVKARIAVDKLRREYRQQRARELG